MFLNADATTLLIVFGSIIMAMSLHEATHAFVAHWLGDTTAYEEGRLTLNPLKHIDLFTTVLLPLVLILLGTTPFFVARPVPFNPLRVKYGEYGAALIGISGPLTNLLLAIVTAFTLRFVSDGQMVSILSTFLFVNVGFFVFNMIPFPPLDGSRLMYAFAPRPLQEIMFRIEAMGFTSILVFMFLLFPLLSPFIRESSLSLINWLARLAS